MEPFYFIVSGVTTIILIILLTLIGIMMSKPNNQELYPTGKLTCPDYWVYSDTSCTWASINAPIGTNLSSTDTYGWSGKTIDFSDSKWKNDICGYKRWAKKYRVNWDGVTNYNGCT